jgi:heme/copper-type cytochrome/quinol oxidase subunit 4
MQMRYNNDVCKKDTNMKSGAKNFLRTFLPLSIILTIIGWGGLLVVVRSTLPTLGPRWLFFFLGVLALTGPALPIIYFLNLRFPSDPPVQEMVILRQALWVGVFGSTVAWLQLGRVLTMGLALILAGVFVLMEFLLRLFERSRWNPNKEG